MQNILKLIRLRQWVKNLFVLVPLFFGGVLMEAEAVFAGIVTLASFCFIASSIYCLNDIRDAEADRKHPVKCTRPIASGAVTIGQAYVFMLVMAVLSVAVLFLLPAHSWEVGTVIVFYFVLNVAYCLRLKEYAIVDVCIVAFGFVLRILAGGIAAEVVLSKWIILMTFLLTLFLSFAKRRDDVLKMDETGIAPRKNTIRYNLTFINQAITITASVTLVCYIMYTVSPEVVGRFKANHLYLTSVFVLVGLLRYIQIAVVDKRSGDPTKVILKDRFTQLVVLGWLVSFLFIIYVL